MKEKRLRERALFALTLSAIALAAVASTMYWARLDLTASRAFTLSRTAKELYREIPERVRVTYYLSKSLSERHPGPAAVEDLLREMEAASKGRISVKVIDPGDDGSTAESLGVPAQQMEVVEKSERRVALVYAGIVVEYLDRHETIPVVISVDTLEYDIVKAVRTAVGARRQVAGLLVGDEGKTVDDSYRTLATALARAGYELRELERGLPVEGDVDVLFVLGNAALDRYDSFFVDQYLMAGGSVFFAVKGVDVDTARGLAARALPAGGLLSVLSAYGMDVGRELVLDQSNLTVPFQTQNQAGAMAISYVHYPHWIAIDERFVSKDHNLTARFSGLDLFWPSPLSVRPLAGIAVTELAKTTPRAWKQVETLAAGPEDQGLYALERDTTTGQYLVAAAAQGAFRSAFASGDIPLREGAPALSPGAMESPPGARFVVVTSADFLSDLMLMSESSFNASFAVSAADWLSSDEDLVALRARTQADQRLNALEDEDTRRFLIGVTYLVCLGFVPLAVVVFGAARASRRSRAEREARTGAAT